ncbi:hypothetical protein AMTR_s00084p00070740 [Amborella trichopoda]|uniref:Uncharacterized protein n=1 Tax=Amborella trichopoda TaxID=13333 RepID=W1P301_AMBTC|nr:hypothetical protein AMTR_s00084p00070740 [Amborella trichopoda]
MVATGGFSARFADIKFQDDREPIRLLLVAATKDHHPCLRAGTRIEALQGHAARQAASMLGSLSDMLGSKSRLAVKRRAQQWVAHGSELHTVVRSAVSCDRQSQSTVAPPQKRKNTRPSVVPGRAINAPSPATAESQDDSVNTSEPLIIPSDREMTPNPGVASLVQEVGPVTIESMHELTLVPSSPRRMSSDSNPCPEERTPSELGEASEATSEELGVTEASEAHKAAVGDEFTRIVGEEESVPFEQLEAIVPNNRGEDVGNDGSNTSQREEPDTDERLEQPEVATPDEVIEALVLG